MNAPICRVVHVILALLVVTLPHVVRGQDFSPIVGLFKNVSSVSIDYGYARLFSSRAGVPDGELFDDASLTGVGAEVYLNLPSPTDGAFELGLGTRYVSGLETVESVPPLSLALLSFPTIAVYATRTQGLLEPYLGASFGITSLWNSSGLADGVSFDVSATTYDYGFTTGLSVDLQHFGLGPVGLFVEAGLTRRVFGSVDYDADDDEATVPPEWPRRLDLSAWRVGAGVQVNLTASAPASFPGIWLLRRVDGLALPAVWHQVGAGDKRFTRSEVVGGRLDLDRTAYKKGDYTLTAHVRQSVVDETGKMLSVDSSEVVDSQVIARGRYDVENTTLYLCQAEDSSPERPALMAEVECDGSDRGVAAHRDGVALVVFDPKTNHVFTFEKASD